MAGRREQDPEAYGRGMMCIRASSTGAGDNKRAAIQLVATPGPLAFQEDLRGDSR